MKCFSILEMWVLVWPQEKLCNILGNISKFISFVRNVIICIITIISMRDVHSDKKSTKIAVKSLIIQRLWNEGTNIKCFLPNITVQPSWLQGNRGEDFYKKISNAFCFNNPRYVVKFNILTFYDAWNNHNAIHTFFIIRVICKNDET